MDDNSLNRQNYGRHFIKNEVGEILLVSEIQLQPLVPPSVKLGPHFMYDDCGNIVSKEELKIHTEKD